MADTQQPQQVQWARDSDQAYSIIRTEDLPTLTALELMLGSTHSEKQLKRALAGIHKTEGQVDSIKWNHEAGKQQFLALCYRVQQALQDDKEGSMRSTRRGIQEMNQELTRMRRSLSEMGILEEMPQTWRNNSFKKDEGEAPEQSNQPQGKDEQNLEHSGPQDTQRASSAKKEQAKANVTRQSKITPGVIISESRAASKKSNKYQKLQKSNQPKQEAKPVAPQPNQYQELFSEEDKHLNDEGMGQEKRYQQQQLQGVKSKNQPQELSQKNYDKQKLSEAKDFQVVQTSLNRRQNEMQFVKTRLAELGRQNNEFVHASPGQKKSRYNPVHEIRKKMVKAIQPLQQPEPKSEPERLYVKIKSKLDQVFPLFVREIKTSDFTFDGYPNSLDLKTFSLYFRKFNLSQLCKQSEMIKIFKKEAINGAWLNFDGFIRMHQRFINLPESLGEHVQDILENKERYAQQYEIQLSQTELSLKISEKQVERKKQPRPKEVERKQPEVKCIEYRSLSRMKQYEQMYNGLLGTLTNLDRLLVQEEIDRMSRKALKKTEVSEQQHFNPDKLRKIVQAHSGRNKQEIINELIQRKQMKQSRRADFARSKIVENARAMKLESQKNSQRVNNSQSSPQLSLHKLEGYTQINRYKKSPEMLSSGLLAYSPNSGQNSQPKTGSKESAGENRPNLGESSLQLRKQLSLPKLPWRKIKQESIYEALRHLETKADFGMAKRLATENEGLTNPEEQKFLQQFFMKERKTKQRSPDRKTPAQQRMKFT